MTDVATDVMTIGAFARRARLSLKALRLYDELGLLPPARVDPDSGYRYYRAAQLRRARLIVLLRRLDMPLATVAEVVSADGEAAAEHLERYWAEAEAEFDARQRVVAYLRDYLFGKDDPVSYPVKTRDIAPQTVLSTSKEVYAKDLPPFIQSSIGALTEHVRDQGGEVAGPPEAIYHGQVDEDNNGPVEVAVPYTGEVVPTGSFTLKDLPARREAYTQITLKQLEFPAILKAYDAVHAWLEANGKTPAGSPREVYFSSDMDPDSDAPFCDIAWPFVES